MRIIARVYDYRPTYRPFEVKMQMRAHRQAPTGEVEGAPLQSETSDGSNRSERGASAVEFALIVPVLALFVFGIIEFGIAFMEMQTIRGALREGGRAAATGASASEVRAHAYDSALGAIDSAANVAVNPNTGGLPVCNPQTIGEDATVSYDTSHLPGGGIKVNIPFMDIVLTPTLHANFRCEV